MAAPILPEEAQREVDELSKKYLLYVHTQAYDEALHIMRSLYRRMLDWQKQYGTRFHKGHPIHNIGYTLHLKNKQQDALKYFILAYIEDLLSADAEDQADSTPAGRTLLLGYEYSPSVLSLLKQTVSRLKKENKTPYTPEEVLQEIAASEPARAKDLEGKITVTPFQTKLREFTRFESDWSHRVFIGGSGALGAIIDMISQKVAELGYDPVVAIRFDTPSGMTVYHKCLALLHNCRYAIFDLSEQAGQLVELERTAEYGVTTLVICQRVKGAAVTQMFRSTVHSRGIRYELYDSFPELDPIFRSFLDQNGTALGEKQAG